jgi:hypothetical protein
VLSLALLLGASLTGWGLLAARGSRSRCTIEYGFSVPGAH